MIEKMKICKVKSTEDTEGTCRPWYKDISTGENNVCSICTLIVHLLHILTPVYERRDNICV